MKKGIFGRHAWQRRTGSGHILITMGSHTDGAAFHDFIIDECAAMTDGEREALRSNSGIIRGKQIPLPWQGLWIAAYNQKKVVL